jgi:hypothetical protein
MLLNYEAYFYKMEDSDVLVKLRRIHDDFNLKRITFHINDLGETLLLDTISLKAIISHLLSVPFSDVHIWTKPSDSHSTKNKIISIKIGNEDLESIHYELLTKEYFINLTETFYRKFD